MSANPHTNMKRLYEMRDGLRQSRLLCAVLEDYGRLVVQTDQEHYSHILETILGRLHTRYHGTRDFLACYACFFVVFDEIKEFANATRSSGEWRQDAWGVEFLSVLDASQIGGVVAFCV
jgi:hypothetical protein